MNIIASVQAMNYGHNIPVMYLNSEKIVVYCEQDICVVCSHTIGECKQNGIKGCKIAVGLCDAGKHTICLSCYFVCCLVIDKSYNGFEHCICKGCSNSSTQSLIKVNYIYACLCKLIMKEMGPPSTNFIESVEEALFSK